jgi:phage gp45-like
MTAMLEARIAQLERICAHQQRQIAGLTQQKGTHFALGRSTLNVNDSGAVQTVQAQLDALSIRDNIPILYHHGFFSAPPIGSDLHVAFLDGDRSKAVVIASNHQSYRMTGAAPGDAGLFAQGQTIHLTSGGIAITGNVALTGNLSVSGSVTAGVGGGDSVTLQGHKHTANNTPPTAGT